MAIVAQPPAPPRRGELEQGVIDDARRRQHRRRRRTAVVVTALAGIAGVLAAVFSGNPSSPDSRPSAHPEGAVALRSRRGRTVGSARLSPALTGGEYGWCLTIEGGGGTCPDLPTADSSLQGALVSTEPSAHQEVITFLLPGEVAEVLIGGRRYRPVDLPGSLPYHLRVARVTIPTSGAPAGSTEDHPVAPLAPTEQSILAIDSRGVVLHPRVNRSLQAAPDRVIWWESPRPVPAGPCQIHARGLPGLQPRWGHVAAQIHSYPARIIGRAFFSCIDTEYYLQNWPLDVAVLLDARHPGSTPGEIPGMKPVAGAAGVFEAPGDWHGDITAARRANAWLVVAGGSGPAQRLEVLHHLATSISRR
jgi:hypothetical protein